MKVLLYEKNVHKDILIRLATITSREWQVLLFLSEGKSTSEIAEVLCITIKSVYNYKNRIGKKLRLSGYHKVGRFASQQRASIEDWRELFKNKSLKERIYKVVEN